MARESYVRRIFKVGPYEITVGLELRPDDDLRELRAALKYRMYRVCGQTAWRHAAAEFDEQASPLSNTKLVWRHDDDAAAAAFEGVLLRYWPDRAYFIEVGGDEDDSWVQVYDPRNFVKERCTCACKT